MPLMSAQRALGPKAECTMPAPRAVDAPTTITVGTELEIGSCYLAHAKPSSGGLSQTELLTFIPLFIINSWDNSGIMINIPLFSPLL